MAKKLISWVRPGLLETLTSLLRCKRQLIKEDLPTFERPAKAISGGPTGGYPLGFTAAVKKSEFLILSPITCLSCKTV
jgi:hypothetical protein